MSGEADVIRDARRYLLRHNSGFYGPMKGARCGCAECQLIRRLLAALDVLEAGQREALGGDCKQSPCAGEATGDAATEEVSERGSSAAVVDTDGVPLAGHDPETVGERQGRQPRSLTSSQVDPPATAPVCECGHETVFHQRVASPYTGCMAWECPCTQFVAVAAGTTSARQALPASEIEALRADLDEARAVVEQLRRNGGDWIVEAANTEILALRAARDKAEHERDEWSGVAQRTAFKLTAAEADRDEAKQGIEYALTCMAEWQDRANEAEAARDKAERALREIDDWAGGHFHPDSWLRQRLGEALGGSEA